MTAKPIIIGGFYRSGTTLLRRILDSHSKINCGPEVKFFKDFYGDYRNDSLAHVRLFATARSYGLSEPQLLSTFGRAFVAFHDEAARSAGKPRWADKNPENVLYLAQWHALLPAGFLFVHMVRNPLDALASLVEIGFEKSIPPDFESKVQLYKKFRQTGDSYLKGNPDTSIEINYDSLVAAPEKTIGRLSDFLGEAFEPAMLTNINAVNRATGIEDPKAALHAKVHNRSIGRGTKDLTLEQQNSAIMHLSQYMN